MKEIYIRNVPEDVFLLLKDHANSKGMTQNDYLVMLLSMSALAGSSCFHRLLPETIQYVVRTSILADDERRQAYSEAQLRLMRENMEVLKRVNLLLMDY